MTVVPMPTRARANVKPLAAEAAEPAATIAKPYEPTPRETKMLTTCTWPYAAQQRASGQGLDVVPRPFEERTSAGCMVHTVELRAGRLMDCTNMVATHARPSPIAGSCRRSYQRHVAARAQFE